MRRISFIPWLFVSLTLELILHTPHGFTIETPLEGAEAYYNRGNTYFSKGEYDRAILDYNKALEINPMDADAYNFRAATYYHKGEYGKAWEDVHKAQGLGYQVHPGFLEDLRQASGRQR